PYHSTEHAVPGIYAGSARVRLGGEHGQSVELRAGDVVVIPAGVAHKRESASPDLLGIGAYPRGQRPDICRAEPAVHDKAVTNIAAVPFPAADPVTGRAAPLLDCWSGAGWGGWSEANPAISPGGGLFPASSGFPRPIAARASLSRPAPSR